MLDTELNKEKFVRSKTGSGKLTRSESGIYYMARVLMIIIGLSYT